MWGAFLRATVLSMMAGLGLTSVMLIITFIIVPAMTMADHGSQALEIIVATFGLLVIALPFAAALNSTLNFGTRERNGICGFSLAGHARTNFMGHRRSCWRDCSLVCAQRREYCFF